MKRNFYVYNEGILLKIAFFSFGLIPLTSERIEVLVSILFCVMVLVSSLLNIKSNNPRKPNSLFVINSLLFFVLLMTFFDGIDLLASKKLEQMVSLYIFPLIFFLVSIHDKNKVLVLFELWKKVFFISTVLFCLISFYLISQYSNPRYPNFDSNFFQNAILDAPYFARDPGYISIFINISILIGFSWVLSARKRIILIVWSLFVLLLLLFMLSVKISIISLITSTLIYLFFILSKKKFIIWFSSILLGIVIFSVVTPNKYNRFSKFFDTNVLYDNSQYNSIFVHKLTILCAVNIFGENLFTGIGVENAKKEVNSCVRQYYTYLPMDIYNSHNQYLGYALYSGILGLSVLFIALFLALYKSYKEDKFLFVIMVLYCIIFLTENVLERQSGLILFCFLLNMIPVIEDYSQTFKKINQKTNT